ncbi:hypothetical protein ACWPM1_08200 [Tsuneonella sp. HG249]
MRLLNSSLAIAVSIAVFACTSDAAEAEVNEVVLLESTEEAAECNAKRSSEAGLSCYRAVLALYRWEIVTDHDLDVTGADAVIVPDANKVLNQVVGNCHLGRALLNHHTDGVAALHIGKGGLSKEQISCVRSFERPGLALRESQGF